MSMYRYTYVSVHNLIRVYIVQGMCVSVMLNHARDSHLDAQQLHGRAQVMADGTQTPLLSSSAQTPGRIQNVDPLMGVPIKYP